MDRVQLFDWMPAKLSLPLRSFSSTCSRQGFEIEMARPYCPYTSIHGCLVYIYINYIYIYLRNYTYELYIIFFWFMIVYSLLLFSSIRTFIIPCVYIYYIYMYVYNMYIYILVSPYIYRFTHLISLIWLGLMPFLCLSVVEDSQFVCSWLAWLLELDTWISSRLQTLASPRFSCRSLWLQRYGNNFVRSAETWWCLGARFCHHRIDFQNLENLVNKTSALRSGYTVYRLYIYMYIYICQLIIATSTIILKTAIQILRVLFY